MYNPKSLKAEEFISHEEILDTLEYAEQNKNNMPLIREILDKAATRKGLNHREASVLLACEDDGVRDEMYALARQIKKDFYGNRIVMFAPLYLSNYCVNGCVYCPYHHQNKHSSFHSLGIPLGCPIKEVSDFAEKMNGLGSRNKRPNNHPRVIKIQKFRPA